MKTATLQNFLNWPNLETEDETDSTELFSLQEAVNESQFEVKNYLETRMYRHLDEPEEALVGTLKLAVARLAWFLDEARNSIAGRFTLDEFVTMLNCFQGDVMSPHASMNIASALCHDLGIELESYEDSPHADLINRLRALSPAQNLALADALEVAWNAGTSGFEVLKSMNLHCK